MEKKASRRVYTPEAKQRLGWGDTWLREMERRGCIARSRKDPGGKRKFWTEDEIEAVINGDVASKAA